MFDCPCFAPSATGPSNVGAEVGCRVQCKQLAAAVEGTNAEMGRIEAKSGSGMLSAGTQAEMRLPAPTLLAETNLNKRHASGALWEPGRVMMRVLRTMVIRSGMEDGKMIDRYCCGSLGSEYRCLWTGGRHEQISYEFLWLARTSQVVPVYLGTTFARMLCSVSKFDRSKLPRASQLAAWVRCNQGNDWQARGTSRGSRPSIGSNSGTIFARKRVIRLPTRVPALFLHPPLPPLELHRLPTIPISSSSSSRAASLLVNAVRMPWRHRALRKVTNELEEPGGISL